MNLEAKVPSIRACAENPNHHLWNNHRTWFLHYTAYPTPFTKERIRKPLPNPIPLKIQFPIGRS